MWRDVRAHDDERTSGDLRGDPLRGRDDGRLIGVPDDDEDRAAELGEPARGRRRELVLGRRLVVPLGQLEGLPLHPPDEGPDSGSTASGGRRGPSTQARRLTSTARIEIAAIEGVDLRRPDRSQSSAGASPKSAPPGAASTSDATTSGRARAASTAIPAPIDVPTRCARPISSSSSRASRSAWCDHGPDRRQGLAEAAGVGPDDPMASREARARAGPTSGDRRRRRAGGRRARRSPRSSKAMPPAVRPPFADRGPRGRRSPWSRPARRRSSVSSGESPTSAVVTHGPDRFALSLRGASTRTGPRTMQRRLTACPAGPHLATMRRWSPRGANASSRPTGPAVSCVDTAGRTLDDRGGHMRTRSLGLTLFGGLAILRLGVYERGHAAPVRVAGAGAVRRGAVDRGVGRGVGPGVGRPVGRAGAEPEDRRRHRHRHAERQELQRVLVQGRPAGRDGDRRGRPDLDRPDGGRGLRAVDQVVRRPEDRRDRHGRLQPRRRDRPGRRRQQEHHVHRRRPVADLHQGRRHRRTSRSPARPTRPRSRRTTPRSRSRRTRPATSPASWPPAPSKTRHDRRHRRHEHLRAVRPLHPGLRARRQVGQAGHQGRQRLRHERLQRGRLPGPGRWQDVRRELPRPEQGRRRPVPGRRPDRQRRPRRRLRRATSRASASTSTSSCPTRTPRRAS